MPETIAWWLCGFCLPSLVILLWRFHQIRQTLKTNTQALAQEKFSAQQIQIALCNAESKFQAAFNSEALGMAILSNEGRVLQANHALCEMLGYEDNEITLLDHEALLHHRDIEIHHQQLNSLLNTQGISYQIESRYHQKDGRVIWGNTSISRLHSDSKNNAHCYLLQLLNITDKKRNEARLIEREHFLRTLSECLPGLVSYFGTDMRCQFANKNHERWTGIDIAKIRGMHVKKIIGDEHFTELKNHIQLVLKGKKQRFETRRTLLTGGHVDLLVHLVPDVIHGHVEGFFSISTNITDFKAQQRELTRINQELVLRTEQAEAASKAKGAFLANMSHEIRTPLNGILGLLQLMQDVPMNARLRDYVQKIGSAAEVLLNVLNDILDISRVEANKLDLNPENFELDGLLSNCIGLFSYRAQEKGIALLCEKHADCPKYILADRLRMAQILNNLLSNALKFTEQGCITLKVNWNIEKHCLQFTIADTGIGMSNSQCDMLFKPFSQIDNSHTRRYGGAGLGLSICKQLLELMQGDISVTSQLGTGTEFHFYIPIMHFSTETNNIQNMEDLVQDPSLDLALNNREVLLNQQIMIVDDHPLNRMVAGEMLKKCGAQVILVESGLDAITQCTQHQFDWVLMDLQMPGMDGFEATRQIQQLLQNKAPKIIALTAATSPTDKENILNAGMYGHLIKPFKREALIEMLINELS